MIIEDRGVPVARLEPIALAEDPEGRVARLQRQGAVRAPLAALPHGWTTARPPRLLKGRSASGLVIEERTGSR